MLICRNLGNSGGFRIKKLYRINIVKYISNNNNKLLLNVNVMERFVRMKDNPALTGLTLKNLTVKVC